MRSCTGQRPVFAHSLGGAGRRETPARISMHDLCPVLEAPSLVVVGRSVVGPLRKDLTSLVSDTSPKSRRKAAG